MSRRRDPLLLETHASTGFRCEHAVVVPEGDEQRIVLAQYQAPDPEAALRWVLDRASCISVHLSASAAETVDYFVGDAGQHAAFLAALHAGHGYGFEVLDRGTRGSVDTLHRFTTRRPRSQRPPHPG